MDRQRPEPQRNYQVRINSLSCKLYGIFHPGCSQWSVAAPRSRYRRAESCALTLPEHPADVPPEPLQRHRALMVLMGCLWHALLLAAASVTELIDVDGRAALCSAVLQWPRATRPAPSLSRQHAVPPQPGAAPPAATPDASRAAASSPASLPLDILESAVRGELPEVVEWLRKGGAIDALCSLLYYNGQTGTASLLHAASRYGHLELVRELLKRGASVDLPSSLGSTTALTVAAGESHLPTPCSSYCSTQPTPTFRTSAASPL